MHLPLCQYPIHKAAIYKLCQRSNLVSRQDLNLQQFRPSNGSVYQFRHGSIVGQMPSTLGGSRTHKIWFLRPARLPVSSQGHIGMAGFEPATFSSQSCRATKLRHIPLVLLVGFEPTHRLFLRQPPLPIGLQEHNLAALPGFEPGISSFKARDVANYTTGQ